MTENSGPGFDPATGTTRIPSPRGETVIFAVNFDRETKGMRPFDLEHLEAEIDDANVFSWIDIQGPDVSFLNDTLRRLGIDLVLVGHFGVPEVLPRIVEREDCLAFYAYEVEHPGRHLETIKGIKLIEFQRTLVVLGTDFVITYHRREVEAVNYVKEQAESGFRLWGKTPGFIVFLILQRCLYDYAHLNLANDNFLDDLEEKAIVGDREELAPVIATAGQNILTLKKLVTSLHIVLMLLASKKSRFISEESRVFYQEMLRNAAEVRGEIDSSRDLLDGIVGAMQAESARETGEIARVLTVVSTIILPLTLIAGVYGMNFHHMPELEVSWAYFAVLGGMGALGIGLLGMFWWLGWLGRGGRRPGE